MGKQLRRISNMPDPDVFKAGRRDKVLTLVFVAQQSHQAFKPGNGFRCALSLASEPVPGFGFVRNRHAARRRAWTSKAAKAAGVIPGTRPAAASVAGCTAVNRSTISCESPGIAA